MNKKLEKKSGKLLWFILGMVLYLLLFLLSLLPVFEWRCPDEICISIFYSNRSIFDLLADGYSLLVLAVFLIYIYEFVFSLIYWFKDIKIGKLIQIVNIVVLSICFIVTFIIAYNAALKLNFYLFFL